MIFQKSLNKNEYLSIIKDEQDDIVSIKFMSVQNKKNWYPFLFIYKYLKNRNKLHSTYDVLKKLLNILKIIQFLKNV